MKKLVVVLLWIATFVVIGFILGSGGEQIARDVAVQQVADSELPYHAVRNLEMLKMVAACLVALPAGIVTLLSFRKG